MIKMLPFIVQASAQSVTRTTEEEPRNGLQAFSPQGGESSGWVGMCLVRLIAQLLRSACCVERRLHYQEPWYELGFDEVDDRRLNHVRSQVSVGNKFLFPLGGDCQDSILRLRLKIPIV